MSLVSSCKKAQKMSHMLLLLLTKLIKSKSNSQNFSSKKKRRLSPAIGLATKLAQTSTNLTSASTQPICNEDELKEALRLFKLVCQIYHKPGHSARRCFKHFNKEFRTHSLQTDTKAVQQALSSLQVNTLDVSQWLPDSCTSSHMSPHIALFDNYIA